MAAKAPHPRTVERKLPARGQSLRAAQLLAPPGKPGARRWHPHSAHAEGADRDEPQPASRLERPDWALGSGDHPRYPGGERDPWKLAALKDNRVKKSKEQIARCLEGDYRKEHLFALSQALELYEFYQAKIAQCDREIEGQLHKFQARIHVAQHPLPEKAKKKTLKAQGDFELRRHLYAICGADLTRIDGMEVLSVQALLSEIGLDMTRWKSEKHFTSWLNLCPPSRISGGKALSRQPRKGHNRAADILRLCAQSTLKSKSALGAFGRRLKARLDAAKAIKAVAHKLARIVYRMLKYGQQYRDAGERYYEEKYQHHLIRRLHKQAAAFGFQLTPQQTTTTTVS